MSEVSLVRAWIDIENAPQVQYLSPFKRELEERGFDVTVTARDQDVTVELLRARGIDPTIVGGPSGLRTFAKIIRLLIRAVALTRRFWRLRPDLLIAASRSSDLAAWLLRIPSFQFTDYEYADDRISRLTRTYLVFPGVIDEKLFLDKGLRPDRLVPFPGLKESVSFACADLDAVEPYPLGQLADDAVRVLVRPPGEATHYFVGESLRLCLEVLDELARRENTVVVYVPRYPHQVSYLRRFEWLTPPHVLRHGVPFLELLAAVDVVISAGGTVLREAAYLGIPAYSILRSGIGQVDRHLEAIGRLRIIENRAQLPTLQRHTGGFSPLSLNPRLPSDIVESMLSLANTR